MVQYPGIGLHDGHPFVQVHCKARSSEFIDLLKKIDAYYSKNQYYY